MIDGGIDTARAKHDGESQRRRQHHHGGNRRHNPLDGRFLRRQGALGQLACQRILHHSEETLCGRGGGVKGLEGENLAIPESEIHAGVQLHLLHLHGDDHLARTQAEDNVQLLAHPFGFQRLFGQQQNETTATLNGGRDGIGKILAGADVVAGHPYPNATLLHKRL